MNELYDSSLTVTNIFFFNIKKYHKRHNIIIVYKARFFSLGMFQINKISVVSCCIPYVSSSSVSCVCVCCSSCVLFEKYLQNIINISERRASMRVISRNRFRGIYYVTMCVFVNMMSAGRFVGRSYSMDLWRRLSQKCCFFTCVCVLLNFIEKLNLIRKLLRNIECLD